MASIEDELKDLKEKNNELVQKVQYWKMTAAQRENEKLELMKEINQLRLKLSRIRSGGAAQARNLDAALQSASEEALSHLVQASSAVARTIQLAKKYMQDRQDLDSVSPRWSNISGTPTPDRIHKVPPMMMGGRSLQPVVSLRRASLNMNSPRSAQRSPNQNRSITQRAVPMHMLQDVYIPLTRIDVNEYTGNNIDTDNEIENESTEDLALEDNIEQAMEVSNESSDDENYENSRRLDAVSEDVEPEDDEEVTPQRLRVDNPLEGPSWLLDRINDTTTAPCTLEPDSTTQLEDARSSPAANLQEVERAAEFTPTVRRRKRTVTSPPLTPRHSPLTPRHSPRQKTGHSRRNSSSGRILKVLVAKMRLDGDATPAKRARSPPITFDAPSPHGATDAGVIVSDARSEEVFGGGDSPLIAACSINRRDRQSRNSSSSVRELNHNNQRDTHGIRGSHIFQPPQLSKDTKLIRDSKQMANDKNISEKIQDNCEVDLGNREEGEGSYNVREDNGNTSGTRAPSRPNLDQRDSQNVTNRSCEDRDSVTRENHFSYTSREMSQARDTSHMYRDDSNDSDSSSDRMSDLRSRRPRKPVTYKEKPLNRKMRR